MKTPGSNYLKYVLVIFAALLARNVWAQVNNAHLHSLTLSAGTLTPDFGASITGYSASVANYVPALTVTPTTISDTATVQVRINGGEFSSVASGSPSGVLALNVGTNPVDVRVISGNFSVTNTYTVTVTRNDPTPPDVQTLAAVVSVGTATLNGVANPLGNNTSAWFEWGPTTNYGNITPAQAMGNGINGTNFSQFINGMPLDVISQFRAVASNQFGVVRGANALAVPTLFTSTADIDLSTGGEPYPHVTQNESAIWSHSNTIVVAYNDSRGLGGSPQSFLSVSVSTNRGATFTRLPYRFTLSAACWGRPSVFYSLRASKWYLSYESDDCFSSGIGQAESYDGLTWSPSGCIALGGSMGNLGNPSTWVDNNPDSPYYGRQYASFNNFSAGPIGSVRTTYSTDDGVTWSPQLNLTFPSGTRRAGKITGSLGPDGTLFLPALDEGGGGTNLIRTNHLFRSTNGGSTWTDIQPTAPFAGPGRSIDSYYVGMYATPVTGYWREMGWGQAGVGPNGVVHYAYSAHSTNAADAASIYYIRSPDNGTNWSAPIQLNTDATIRAQWNPSLSVNPQGIVFVSWYDERNTVTNGLERFGRASLDNGVSWGNDEAISDVVFPVPLQPDFLVVSNFVGHYNFTAFSDDGYGDVSYQAWVDGRVNVGNMNQQDIFFDQIRFGSALQITSITRAANSDIVLLGTGRPNLVHSVQVSTNLAPGSFSNSSSVTPNSFGMWQLNAGPAVSARRFYRLAYP